MRTAFVRALCHAADTNPNIWLVCGDLGYTVLEAFRDRFPARFVNAGVAEQNMIGLGAGLALCGKQVWLYSIANFPVMRCLEQIRNDVCHHDLDVKVVAVGGGLVYGAAGFSHHGTEDIAVMRAMPRMRILAPADPVETSLAVDALAEAPGPAYLRLGKSGERILHDVPPVFEIGKAIWVRDGTDCTLATTGALLGEVIDAGNRLAAAGLNVAVVSFPTIQPLDRAAVSRAARSGVVFCVEDHGRGGLAGALAEALCELPSPTRLVSLRLPDEPLRDVQTQKSAHRLFGLDAAGIEATVVRVLSSEPPSRR